MGMLTDLILIGVAIGGALFCHKHFGPEMDSIIRIIETQFSRLKTR